MGQGSSHKSGEISRRYPKIFFFNFESGLISFTALPIHHWNLKKLVTKSRPESGQIAGMSFEMLVLIFHRRTLKTSAQYLYF